MIDNRYYHDIPDIYDFVCIIDNSFVIWQNATWLKILILHGMHNYKIFSMIVFIQ